MLNDRDGGESETERGGRERRGVHVYAARDTEVTLVQDSSHEDDITNESDETERVKKTTSKSIVQSQTASVKV